LNSTFGFEQAARGLEKLGRDIAGAAGQMTAAGQGDFFKLFP
jgi:hypothetical protein